MPAAGRVRAPARIDTRVVRDVDAVASAMAEGLRAEYVQLESKPFRVRWTTVRWSTCVIQFVSEEVAVARRLEVMGDRWAFMIPLETSPSARWNARAVFPDDIIVCPPRTACLAFDPPLTRFAILTAMESSASAAAARELVGQEVKEPFTAPCGPPVVELHDRLMAIRDRFETIGTAPEPGTNERIERCLLSCLKHWTAKDERPGMADVRSQIVRRAEEFFRTHMSEGVSVAQLSTVAGVSERSLRNAFHDVYTTSPKRYMKLWQLHQVRRVLRAGAERRATVTDVATCHGFYELGRFAGAYKSLFGEAPSDTLSKARHQPTIA